MSEASSAPQSQARKWPGRRLVKSPIWCSVDLRDGNQSLPSPLSPSAKLKYFRSLLKTGFKEIEIGFPSSNQSDWDFCRKLIDEDLIPDDVTVAVLTPARDSLIRKTMECVRGARRVICHLFLPVSELHTRFVLGKSRSKLLDLITESVMLLRKLAQAQPETEFQLEFSPEEFEDCDLDYSLEICTAAVRAWQPSEGEKVILNLPCTVERILPTAFADMIEEFIRRNPEKKRTIISVHPHNDMGTAVAQAELAMLAGATRVEGTLFGNGERAGNLDLVTLAINCQVLGLETGLDFSQLEALRDRISSLTGIPVPSRHPYAGNLAFTAFSGTHQDAIHKGLDRQDKISRYFGSWKLPYLNINPESLGRHYQDFIRINAQSGKSGIDFVLRQSFGVSLPDGLLVEFRQLVKKASTELSPDALWQLLLDTYLKPSGSLELLKYWPHPDPDTPSLIHSEVLLLHNGQQTMLKDAGDGPVAAFAAAIRQLPLPSFRLESYQEQALGTSVNANSLTIVSLASPAHDIFYGLGLGNNIVQGATQAIISALNRMLSEDKC